MKINAAFAIGLALAGALSAAPAQALNQHSFVASFGNDANACTLAAPCRHLQAALAATISGGEIAILDTAGYNGGTTVTITQAVSIVNPGGFEAAIAPPSGGIGIVINAGPNDAVNLRGLSIDGAGVGAQGIQFNIGASLTVENCVIRYVTANAIEFLPNASSSLSVSNSLMANNYDGIIVAPSGSGVVTIVLNRVEANNNSNNGIELDGNNSPGKVVATVSDSIAAGNVGSGLLVTTAVSTGSASLMVTHSVVANNQYGIVAQGTGATLRLANSTVTGNTHGWNASLAGVVDSYGDNYIDGNGANIGTLTAIPKQ